MTTHKEAISLVKEVFPNVSEEMASDLLWERTSWPIQSNKQVLRAELNLLKENLDNKIIVCDTCNNAAAVVGKYFVACKRCFLSQGGKNYWWHRFLTIFNFGL